MAQTNLRSPLLQHPLAMAFWVVVLVGLARLVPFAWEVLFVGFAGILLAIVFSFPTKWLSRVIPRGAAVLVTLVAFCGLLIGLGALSAPVLSRQAHQLGSEIPRAADQVEAWLQHVETRAGLAEITSDGDVVDSLQGTARKAARTLLARMIPAAVSVVSVVSGTVLIVILAAFLAYQPDSYRDAIRSLVPVERESVFDETWQRLGIGLSHWVGGMLVAMTLMGSLTALGVWAIGLESWPLLGVLTFLGTSIPYLGAIASAVPGLILGLADSPATFFYTLLVYAGVHVVEGYLVQPYVMKRAVELRPAFLLLWQVLMGTALGLPGIVLATPLLVCAKVIGGHLWIERRLGKAGPDV
jgi:predicted PurR-regulated permease PerM